MTGHGGDGPPDLPRGFGRPNPSCATCGDERGGPHGHVTADCQYWEGISVDVLVQLPHLAGRQAEVWGHYVDRYFKHELARTERPTITADILKENR
jgi:hypothetical protein